MHKEGFSGFKRYVTAAEDKELEAKIAVVEKYNIRIPELVERIERCHIEDLDFAGKESSCYLPFKRRSGWSLEVPLRLWLPVTVLSKTEGTGPGVDPSTMLNTKEIRKQSSCFPLFLFHFQSTGIGFSRPRSAMCNFG